VTSVLEGAGPFTGSYTTNQILLKMHVKIQLEYLPAEQVPSAYYSYLKHAHRYAGFGLDEGN
jgi:hypothetical protein